MTTIRRRDDQHTAGAARDRRRRRGPSSARSASPRVPSPRLPVAGRPRRAPAPTVVPAPGRLVSTPATTSAAPAPTRRADIKRNVERFLARARRRPRRERADRHAGQRAGLRPRVRPADRLLVLRHRRHVAVRGRRGAQHLRRTPRLPADARTRTGRPASNKQFYVSPFNDVSGDYAMRFTLTDHHVEVTISLRRDGPDRVRRLLHRQTDAGHHDDDRSVRASAGRPCPSGSRR